MIAEQQVKQDVKCYHCGEDCDEGIITYDDKPFCCTGCRLVFQLLKDSGLTSYYSIEQSPGIKQEVSQEYSYLDNQSIRDQLLEYQSGQLNRVTFELPAIHCSACIYLLENLNKLHPAVIRTQVNFIKKEASIDYDPNDIKLSELASLFESIGYIPNIQIDRKKRDVSDQYARELVLKIAVAGFCFGNIMLLSFPEYLGMQKATDGEFHLFFSILNIALSIPVLLYSGWGYFESAVKSIQQRYLNLDVPIALGMLTLVSRSWYEIITSSGPGYLDSFAGLVFFLLLGKWFQNRTYDFLSFERDYRSYFPLGVNLVKGEEIVSVTIDDLAVGDRLEIKNGGIIPADSVLCSDHASLDYSFVTGESDPQMKHQGQVIYAGGRLVGQSVVIEVVKEVSKSYLTRLWNHDAFKKEDTYRTISDRISKYFTVTIISIAIISALVWYALDPSKTWEVFTAILIVACPCALALAAPFTMGNALRVLGKNRLYLKNPEVIEKMSEIDTIVFDKTGTVTIPSAQEIYPTAPLSLENEAILSALVRHSSHPISQKIAQCLGHLSELEVNHFKEIPGQGVMAEINGKPTKLGSAKFLQIPAEDIVSNRVYFQIDQELGSFELKTTYRSGLRKLLQDLVQLFRLHLLTGDSSRLEKERFQKDFEDYLSMSFNQSPEDKLAYLNNLQKEDYQVMMVGDGLNDAGALRQSDVGVAITDDTGYFTPASDAILEGKRITDLPKFLSLSKASRWVVKASFVLSFLYNIVGISFAVAGYLTPLIAAILMPLSSISVVVFSTLAVNFFASKLRLL